MEKEKSNFGINVKFLRENSEMTQQQLADKLHYTRDGISKWETQGRRPDHEALRELAKLFNIHIDELLDLNFPEIIKNISSNIVNDYFNGFDEPIAECNYLKQYYISEYEKICKAAFKDNDKDLLKYCINGYIKNGGKNAEYIRDVYYKISSLEEDEDDKIDIYEKIYALGNYIDDAYLYTWQEILNRIILNS